MCLLFLSRAETVEILFFLLSHYYYYRTVTVWVSWEFFIAGSGLLCTHTQNVNLKIWNIFLQ